MTDDAWKPEAGRGAEYHARVREDYPGHFHWEIIAIYDDGSLSEIVDKGGSDIEEFAKNAAEAALNRWRHKSTGEWRL